MLNRVLDIAPVGADELELDSKVLIPDPDGHSAAPFVFGISKFLHYVLILHAHLKPARELVRVSRVFILHLIEKYEVVHLMGLAVINAEGLKAPLLASVECPFRVATLGTHYSEIRTYLQFLRSGASPSSGWRGRGLPFGWRLRCDRFGYWFEKGGLNNLLNRLPQVVDYVKARFHLTKYLTTNNLFKDEPPRGSIKARHCCKAGGRVSSHSLLTMDRMAT